MSGCETSEGDIQAPDGSLVEHCGDLETHSPHGEHSPEPGLGWWCPGSDSHTEGTRT